MSYNENLATLQALFEGVEEGVLVWILEESGGDLQRAIDTSLEITAGRRVGVGGMSPPSIPSVQKTKAEEEGGSGRGREGKGRLLTQEDEDAELARSLHQELNLADRDAEYARQLQQSFDLEGLRPSSSPSSSSPGARFPFPSSRLPSSSPLITRDVGGGLDYSYDNDEEDDYEYEEQDFSGGRGGGRAGFGSGAEKRRGGVGVGMLGLGGGTETLSQFLEQILTDGSWFSALQPGMAHFKSMIVNIVDEQIRVRKQGVL
jgi:hypothetical protein